MSHIEVEEDFGQKVDLTVRIREILSNYASGISIIKELIQNADDAGAKVVRFCYDQRSHPISSLAYPKFSCFQGPSLLCYNDAEFSEQDFVSIQNIGNSEKKQAVAKTGRFGLGFNAVYHFTDVPSFVSGRYVVYFDPHATTLPNINASNPGKRLDFVKGKLLDVYPDQFAAFRMFGCDMKSPFEGTMFRFPLRTAEQAHSSRLSKYAYTEGEMKELFAALEDESTRLLLFVKNVRHVEWYDCTSNIIPNLNI
jgi:sacsin